MKEQFEGSESNLRLFIERKSTKLILKSGGNVDDDEAGDTGNGNVDEVALL